MNINSDTGYADAFVAMSAPHNATVSSDAPKTDGLHKVYLNSPETTAKQTSIGDRTVEPSQAESSLSLQDSKNETVTKIDISDVHQAILQRVDTGMQPQGIPEYMQRLYAQKSNLSTVFFLAGKSPEVRERRNIIYALFGKFTKTIASSYDIDDLVITRKKYEIKVPKAMVEKSMTVEEILNRIFLLAGKGNKYRTDAKEIGGIEYYYLTPQQYRQLVLKQAKINGRKASAVDSIGLNNTGLHCRAFLDLLQDLFKQHRAELVSSNAHKAKKLRADIEQQLVVAQHVFMIGIKASQSDAFDKQSTTNLPLATQILCDYFKLLGSVIDSSSLSESKAALGFVITMIAKNVLITLKNDKNILFQIIKNKSDLQEEIDDFHVLFMMLIRCLIDEKSFDLEDQIYLLHVAQLYNDFFEQTRSQDEELTQLFDNVVLMLLNKLNDDTIIFCQVVDSLKSSSGGDYKVLNFLKISWIDSTKALLKGKTFEQLKDGSGCKELKDNIDLLDGKINDNIQQKQDELTKLFKDINVKSKKITSIPCMSFHVLKKTDTNNSNIKDDVLDPLKTLSVTDTSDSCVIEITKQLDHVRKNIEIFINQDADVYCNTIPQDKFFTAEYLFWLFADICSLVSNQYAKQFGKCVSFLNDLSVEHDRIHTQLNSMVDKENKQNSDEWLKENYLIDVKKLNFYTHFLQSIVNEQGKYEKAVRCAIVYADKACSYAGILLRKENSELQLFSLENLQWYFNDVIKLLTVLSAVEHSSERIRNAPNLISDLIKMRGDILDKFGKGPREQHNLPEGRKPNYKMKEIKQQVAESQRILYQVSAPVAVAEQGTSDDQSLQDSQQTTPLQSSHKLAKEQRVSFELNAEASVFVPHNTIPSVSHTVTADELINKFKALQDRLATSKVC